MQFSVVMVALFSALAVAKPTDLRALYPNLAPRGTCTECEGQSREPCCAAPANGCCYVCKEGSDADCAPEVTERSIFAPLSGPV